MKFLLKVGCVIFKVLNLKIQYSYFTVYTVNHVKTLKVEVGLGGLEVTC